MSLVQVYMVHKYVLGNGITPMMGSIPCLSTKFAKKLTLMNEERNPDSKAALHEVIRRINNSDKK